MHVMRRDGDIGHGGPTQGGHAGRGVRAASAAATAERGHSRIADARATQAEIAARAESASAAQRRAA